MTRRETISVTGMSCDGCEHAVENALQSVDAVREARADHETGTVAVVTDEDARTETLEDAVHDAGYDVED